MIVFFTDIRLRVVPKSDCVHESPSFPNEIAIHSNITWRETTYGHAIGNSS